MILTAQKHLKDALSALHPHEHETAYLRVFEALVDVTRIVRDVYGPAVPVREDKARQVLVVDRCPWCMEQHEHGAGGGLGPRRSHCATRSQPYLLVEAVAR